MFAYCNNNPVSRTDPTGEWSWGGFLTGLAVAAMGIVMVAASVATLGAATPLAAAALSATTTAVVGLAATATGTTMAYAAATDQAMVIDASFSVPTGGNEYKRYGASLVLDFGNDYAALYTHDGHGEGFSAGFSFSTGVVRNAPTPESYEGTFYDYSAGFVIGAEHCYAPEGNYKNRTSATCLTFGKGASAGVCCDEYKLILSTR